jgi:hypothetical protein
MSKTTDTEWQTHGKLTGQKLPHLTGNLARHLAVTVFREKGKSRQEQEVLARHMSHRVETADRVYDDAKMLDAREGVINVLEDIYMARGYVVFFNCIYTNVDQLLSQIHYAYYSL